MFTDTVPPGLSDEPVIAQFTYVRLIQLRRSPLLPTLRQLRCPSVDLTLPTTLFLLSPTLEHIELLDIPAAQDHLVGSFLSALADELPALKHLTLHGHLSQHLLSYIPSLRNLSSLKLWEGKGSPKQELSLEEIGELPHLTNLVINLRHPRFGGGSGFRGLKNIQMTGWNRHLAKKLADLGALRMESISLVTSGNMGGKTKKDPSHPLGRCLDIMCSRWPDSLRAITIAGPSLRRLSVTDLSPLLDLRHLDTLHFGNQRLLLSDSNVELLASAWTQLRSLQLPPSSELTLSGVRSLAACCRGLKYLRLALNTASISRHVVGPPMPAHHLDTLAIGSKLPIGSLPLAARCLDRLFPCLKTVHADDEHNGDQWRQVYDLIWMCQAVRSDERDRTVPP